MAVHPPTSSEITADHVGRLVSIQVFERQQGSPETLLRHSLVQWVGILEGYVMGPGMTMIKLQGFDLIRVSDSSKYYELYLHPTNV